MTFTTIPHYPGAAETITSVRTRAPALPRMALALILLAFTWGCSSVDIGGPKTSKRNPDAGTLEVDGKSFAVLPAELNYSGQGTYTWPDGRRRTGTWQAGLLQGMGTEQTGQETYTGQWHKGKRHGHGELVKDSGTRYVGDFVEGLAEGKGTQTSAAGVYRGTWQQGMRHGQGQLNGADGEVYQGQWQADLRAGYGQAQYANGDVYAGEWQDDKPQGFGRFLFANGAAYEGSWEDGQQHGYGVWTSAAEVRYEGTWRAGQRHGFGKETRPDGSYFAGMWEVDARHGEGEEIYPDGSAHRGQWQHDRIDGPGSRTNRAGIVISGNWQQNSVIEGSLALPDGPSYQGPLFSEDGTSVATQLVAWLERRAAQGDPHAQYFLGSALLDFERPAADPNTAMIWLTRSAEAGVAEAQYRLAVLLLENDAGSALQWLRRAAALQHPTANQVLGEFFHTGQHFEQDLRQAIKHYEAASARGSLTATNNLAWLLATAAAQQIADPDRAIQLIRPLVLYLGNWQHLDTLAAAHARVGDTELAERLQKQALIQAQSVAPEQVVAEMSARLDLYAQDQAYTE